MVQKGSGIGGNDKENVVLALLGTREWPYNANA